MQVSIYIPVREIYVGLLEDLAVFAFLHSLPNFRTQQDFVRRHLVGGNEMISHWILEC